MNILREEGAQEPDETSNNRDHRGSLFRSQVHWWFNYLADNYPKSTMVVSGQDKHRHLIISSSLSLPLSHLHQRRQNFRCKFHAPAAPSWTRRMEQPISVASSSFCSFSTTEAKEILQSEMICSINYSHLLSNTRTVAQLNGERIKQQPAVE